MSEETERFIANGGDYERVPVGAMAETGWKSSDYAPNSKAMRNRSFQQMEIAKAKAKQRDEAQKAEREARKAAKVVEPLRQKAAPRPKAAKPSRAVVKVRKVRPPKSKAGPKPKARKPAPFAREGTDKARILELVGHDWTNVAALCEQTGITPHHVRESLRLLKARGLVECTGGVFYRHWRRVGGKAGPIPPPPARPRSGLTLRVLEAVRAGHTRAGEIAKVTKASPKDVSVRLWHLSRGGLVELEGRAHAARWKAVDAADR